MMNVGVDECIFEGDEKQTRQDIGNRRWLLREDDEICVRVEEWKSGGVEVEEEEEEEKKDG